jgi:TPP-dependent pyruvate/acetoin dehydrogenase alpha subunit
MLRKPMKISFSANAPRDLLGCMMMIRRFDERLLGLQKRQLIPGHTSPYVGQEAVAVGVAAELASGDHVASHHRPTGHALAAGLDPARLFAEFLGRSGGYCRGKAGKHQVSSLEHGFVGANGVVGGGIPIAVGTALGLKMQGKNAITVAYFGDGAANTGAFHEALNLAAVWKLPVLFVCENNGYAFSTKQEDHTLVEHISDRASSYGMSGAVAEGNDIEALRAVIRPTVAKVRAGEGPALVDVKTYRWYGQHDGDDSLSYRSQEEIDSWKSRCPIDGYKTRLLERGELTEATFAELAESVEATLEQAETWAVDSPPAPVEEAAMHVYAASEVR